MPAQAEDETLTTTASPKQTGSKMTKLVVLLTVVAAALFACHNYGDALSLDYL